MAIKAYESLVWDENQLVNFYNTFFSKPSPFHTDFFCLVARKKYMTEEDRKKINLGDTCMMFKTILKDYNLSKFLSKIYQADASASYFTDRDGNFIPRYCITFYMNINKTNVLKATKEFKNLLNDWDYDLASSIMFNNQNKKENLGKQLKTIENNLLKSFQNPKNTEGDWLDIDCDIGTGFDASKFKMEMVSFLGAPDVHIISTHGGCHILVSKQTISDYNKGVAEVFAPNEIKNHIMTLSKILDFVKKMVLREMPSADIKEIKLNQNMMIPIPGTLQGSFPVKMT